MAQYRAIITSSRATVSRLGHKPQGMTACVNGWHGGVKVHAAHIDGKDVFAIYSTGGSNAFKSPEYLGSVSSEGLFTPAESKIAF